MFRLYYDVVLLVCVPCRESRRTVGEGRTPSKKNRLYIPRESHAWIWIRLLLPLNHLLVRFYEPSFAESIAVIDVVKKL